MWVKRTLTKEQLNKFFRYKNRSIVSKEAIEGWRTLSAAGMTENADSTTEVRQAISYYIEWYKIKDLYRHHSSTQKKNLAELSKQMPFIPRALDLLNKKASIEERRKKDAATAKGFVW